MDMSIGHALARREAAKYPASDAISR